MAVGGAFHARVIGTHIVTGAMTVGGALQAFILRADKGSRTIAIGRTLHTAISGAYIAAGALTAAYRLVAHISDLPAGCALIATDHLIGAGFTAHTGALSVAGLVVSTVGVVVAVYIIDASTAGADLLGATIAIGDTFYASIVGA